MSCQRDQIQAAQRLSAVSSIVVNVTLGLDNHFPVGTGQLAQSDVISQRSGGHEHGAFFSEPVGKYLFEFLDNAAIGVGVGLYRVGLGTGV
jgi:hypothetical protein